MLEEVKQYFVLRVMETNKNVYHRLIETVCNLPCLLAYF